MAGKTSHFTCYVPKILPYIEGQGITTAQRENDFLQILGANDILEAISEKLAFKLLSYKTFETFRRNSITSCSPEIGDFL